MSIYWHFIWALKSMWLLNLFLKFLSIFKWNQKWYYPKKKWIVDSWEIKIIISYIVIFIIHNPDVLIMMLWGVEVFTWTLLRWRYHLFSPGRDREIRGLRVITLLWIVKMVWVSTLTQATCSIDDGDHEDDELDHSDNNDRWLWPWRW